MSIIHFLRSGKSTDFIPNGRSRRDGNVSFAERPFFLSCRFLAPIDDIIGVKDKLKRKKMALACEAKADDFEPNIHIIGKILSLSILFSAPNVNIF